MNLLKLEDGTVVNLGNVTYVNHFKELEYKPQASKRTPTGKILYSINFNFAYGEDCDNCLTITKQDFDNISKLIG